ncbi:5'-3' exoribonuclease 1 [Anopheles nili]|uniref:5'-3' exoribonuclease 1 n=1 Tax=Anopheles nili TaxID=185578 RepID=UPI00237B7D33|nr:5'-3' exoribonuclease 1 [Anopheles nili]
MGVPKFFRYMSERYPCLSELLRENQVPEFDNLYLDMNGIIHNCSHPNDADVNFRISEEMIFEGIFLYVEYLFKLIRPQKVFFIAVDGVAPRAKMNQQRGRRFRSAFEAQELLNKAIAKGEAVPSDDRFDSNCITPGTAFMVRLQKALEHFIQVKIATDLLWKACTVILSGHETPGEGEHKIMEYIRHAKAQPGFNPNSRHCLYGLDADLIMLGLCTHERYFSLLREEVKFGKTNEKATGLKDIRFYLLHLTLLSEYLELEFAGIRDRLRFPFEVQKLIDDWILLVYLVGNDFIPHLPHLHINENALPTLYNAYMDVLPEMDGYINEGGILNLPRLQLLMKRMSSFDREVFLDRYTDLKYLEAKCGKDNLDAFDVTAEEIAGSADMDKDLMALIMSTAMLNAAEDDEEDAPVSIDDLENDPELFEKEFHSYKRNYYMTKMGYADFTEEVRAEQTECYIRALQWTLHYYYRGVQSWSWYYPHHYAPFISDIDNFADLKLDYELASPFLPFQQLLSVLPAASKQHLPAAYHQLMTDPDSPVYDFYPPEFNTDLNGKQQSWEAVVLIPFIDEKRLLKAMGPCDQFLTDEEKRRNVHGPMLQYRYDSRQTEPLEAKYGFARIDMLPVRRQEIWRDELYVDERKLVLGPSKGAIWHGYAKGFPTFKHLSYHGELKTLRVKIFNFPSKNDSMMVMLDSTEENSSPDTSEFANKLLGQIVHVSWPHLMEAIVVRVSDRTKTYERNSKPLQTDEKSFNMWCGSITEHNKNRLAIDVGPIQTLVHVRNSIGTEYVLKDNGFILNRIWNNIETAYPAQAIVRSLQDVMKKQKPYLSMNEMFPQESTVFMRATEFYGSMGKVADVSGSTMRVQVRFLVYEEPNLQNVFQVYKQSCSSYRNANDTAAMLGISVGLLLQLTGSILVAPGGHRAMNTDEQTFNIGLRLRAVSKDEEAVGYCRKINKTWLFSDKTVALVQEYAAHFPNLFEKLECSRKTNIHFETDLFGETSKGKLQELQDWLKKQGHMNTERRSCGIIMLDEKAIETLVDIIDGYRDTHKPKVQTMFVDPKELYRPGMKQANVIDPAATFELLDRVTVVKETENVPVGARGTIVGIHRVTDPNPVRREAITQADKYFEILFDQPFCKGVNIYNIPSTEKRVLRLAQSDVLNISYGKMAAGHRYKIQPSVNSSSSQQSATITATGSHNKQSTATAESIQQRISERISKRDNIWRIPKGPAETPAGIHKQAIAESNLNKGQLNNEDQVNKIEFEKLWKKMKETSKNSSGGLFDERDIQNFVQVPRQRTGQQTKQLVEYQCSKSNLEATTPEEAQQISSNNRIIQDNNREYARTRSGDNRNEVSTQMLPISETSQLSSIIVPAPTSLPKPPLQWQRMDQCAGPAVETSPFKNNDISKAPTQMNGSLNPSVFFAQFANAAQQQVASMMANPLQPVGFRSPLMRAPSHVSQQQQPFSVMSAQSAFVPAVPNMHHSAFGAFQPPTMIAPPTARNHIRPPMPFSNRNEPIPRPPYVGTQSVPFQQHLGNARETEIMTMQQYPTTSRGPKGPQNLSYNRNNPAGNGAFVPLQVMKKTGRTGNVTTGGSVTNVDGLMDKSLVDRAQSDGLPSSSNTKTTLPPTAQTISSTPAKNGNSFNEKNARRRQEVELKQAEMKQGFTTFLSQKNRHNNTSNKNALTRDEKKDIVIVKNDAIKPKTRIAAKFGTES